MPRKRKYLLTLASAWIAGACIIQMTAGCTPKQIAQAAIAWRLLTQPNVVVIVKDDCERRHGGDDRDCR